MASILSMGISKESAWHLHGLAIQGQDELVKALLRKTLKQPVKAPTVLKACIPSLLLIFYNILYSILYNNIICYIFDMKSI